MKDLEYNQVEMGYDSKSTIILSVKHSSSLRNVTSFLEF
jgi:hypothetical protein